MFLKPFCWNEKLQKSKGAFTQDAKQRKCTSLTICEKLQPVGIFASNSLIQNCWWMVNLFWESDVSDHSSRLPTLTQRWVASCVHSLKANLFNYFERNLFVRPRWNSLLMLRNQVVNQIGLLWVIDGCTNRMINWSLIFWGVLNYPNLSVIRGWRFHSLW